VAERPFEFDLFRLVVVEPEIFEILGSPVAGDDGLLNVLRESCAPRHDVSILGAKNQWKWSLRDFEVTSGDLFDRGVGIATARLARSLLEQTAAIVTDETIVEGLSHAEPPAATPIRLVFYMERHLVAIEHNSTLMATKAWLDALHQIFDRAAAVLELRSQIRLEPVPEANQVLAAFFSFQRLTQIRATLLLPNPEISRFAKGLYDQMRSGGVREYLNDLKSPSGLSQSMGELPHAVASLAQDGYKKGEVVLNGVKDGARRRIRTGRNAARGQVDQVRDFIRGQVTIARTREAQAALAAVLGEIDRIHPAPDSETGRQ